MRLRTDRIRLAMIEKGFIQDDQFAYAMGWSKSKLSRVLAGKQRVTDVVVSELAAALGRKEADIVELEDVAQTDFERAMLYKARHADDSRRRAVAAILDMDPPPPQDP